jgi:hypothetical protein
VIDCPVGIDGGNAHLQFREMMASFTPSVICLHALRSQQRKACASRMARAGSSMIPDDIPARGAKPETASAELKVANDDGGVGAISIDPRILVIARAVGRQLAREKLDKQQAVNDNTSEHEP